MAYNLSIFWNRSRMCALWIAVAPWLGASYAFSAPITVVNPGFEDISGESPFNEFTFGPLNGWALYDPGNITDGGDGPTYFIGTLTPVEPDPIGNPGVYEFFPNGASEGQRVGIAFNFFGSGNAGEYGMVQTLADTLQSNTRYTLSVEIGNIASGTSVSNDFFDLDGFPGYRVDLLAGGVVIAQDVNTLAGTIAEGTFATSTVVFTTGGAHAQLGQQLGIRLVNLNQIDPMFADSDLEVDFDNVQLDASAVPEPSAGALAAAGLLALGSFGLRKFRQLDNGEQTQAGPISEPAPKISTRAWPFESDGSWRARIPEE